MNSDKIICASESFLSSLKETLCKEEFFCPITHETIPKGSNIIMLPCGHQFEPNSIKKWLGEKSNACPICRTEYEKNISINDSYMYQRMLRLNNMVAIHPFGTISNSSDLLRIASIVNETDNDDHVNSAILFLPIFQHLLRSLDDDDDDDDDVLSVLSEIYD